jgi:GT2 family glycosyltransferase
MTVADLTVAVCTRNRSALLARTLDAVDSQSDQDFAILVVDQSDAEDPDLASRARRDDRLEIVHGTGRGASRARNAAAEAATTEWVVFLDDDCLLDPDWIAELRAARARHPHADLVSGHVAPAEGPAEADLSAAAREVGVEREWQGPRVWPQRVGFSLAMALRRRVVLELGGWDERFGPGGSVFSAGGDDVDFNYRFLASGRTAVVTPRLRARHLQWRTREEIVLLYGDYSAAWAGFSMKHLRHGDVRGGAWLWTIGVRSTARMLASGARHRSATRWRAGLAQARGLTRGTARGLRHRW